MNRRGTCAHCGATHDVPAWLPPRAVVYSLCEPCSALYDAWAACEIVGTTVPEFVAAHPLRAVTS